MNDHQTPNPRPADSGNADGCPAARSADRQSPAPSDAARDPSIRTEPVLPQPRAATPSDAGVARDQPAAATTHAPDRQLPELLPVRMLNEFTYCPRLGYLEWVQGEWAENLETLQGTFGHRNVDRPGRKPVPAAKDPHDSEKTRGETIEAADDEGGPPQPDTIHARSLMLSAPSEGLIAKLDLLELEGDTATPVDYKRGSVPDLPEGAYEPERVQLCAQGLILRENGYACREGIIYYIESRRRVTIPFDEQLVERTRDRVRECRDVASAGTIPPPLVDSPKCPRCSLVGICLPDETNLLRAISPEDVEEPEADDTADNTAGTVAASRQRDGLRRLLPARDDALPLYLQDQGLTLGKKGQQLVIRKKGETQSTVRLIDVSQVCTFGSVHVTEPVLRELATRGVPVCHFSYGGWFYAMTTGLVHKNVELRIRQFALAADTGERLRLARLFVTGKIKNGRTMLRRHLDPGVEKDRMLWQLGESVKKAAVAESTESLLGIEGAAARVYFSGFARLLKGGEPFDIEGRNRRPPKDPVNALLSFLYAILVKELTVTLQAVGFDPMLGFYHQPRYGRPSLALDLAEEFRPLVADSTVLTLINNGEVSAASFISRAGSVALTDAGRRAVLAAFERRLNSEVTHPIFGYRASYRRILEVQSRLLARTVLGELHAYPSFCTR